MIRARNRQWMVRALFVLCSVTVWSCDDDDLPPDEVYARAKPGVDFKEYKTFKIDDTLTKEELEAAGVDTDKIPKDVKYNIDIASDQARQELEDRGLDKVGEDEEADLVIASLGSKNDEDAIYWDCVPGYWWGYWGWYWDDCAWLEPEHVSYTIGSVAVGLADPKMKDMVFGGLVQGVGYGGAGDELEFRIRSGVHQMFFKYPVDPTDSTSK